MEFRYSWLPRSSPVMKFLLLLKLWGDTPRTLFDGRAADIAPISTTRPWNACDIDATSSFQIRKVSRAFVWKFSRRDRKHGVAVTCAWRGKVQKSGCDSVARMRPALRKKRNIYMYDLALVCYPSLSIDLLYDFKKVQPMPNHPVIFSSLPKHRKKIRHLLSPFSPSLSHIAFVSGR